MDAKLRKDALTIFKASLASVEPGRVVHQTVTRSGETLKIVQGKKVLKTFNLSKTGRIFVVGAGKATAPMAQALEKILGARIEEGVISVKKGHGLSLKRVKVMEAAHPVPDKAGVRAARTIKAVLEAAEKDDLVFSLISGGGSALLPLPSDGLNLLEKQSVTKLLLACGASIHEINAVRKHLSQVKGGQMARAAFPATVVNLMLSDVVGDDMDTIASGPFVADRSSFEEVAVILAKYRLMKKVPAAVRNHLRKGLTGQIPDTPKPGDPALSRVTNVIVGSNWISLKAAEAEAKKLGYRPLILSSSIEGETREVARVHAAMGREVKASGYPIKAPACLISGGETTVTLHGKGKGGRNQEFALAAALDIDGHEGVLVFSAGTDGTDGPTDAAGAMADWNTCRRAAEADMNPVKHLQENNAYPFFQALDDLVMTGPTRTNVMDVRLVLAV
ncbi:MAG: glycerate kinase [Proteobacteria bacterium]|nr:glycerate kinase [Pseudomonadota bacterium]